MQRLSQHYDAGLKRVAEVEVTTASNQHELNGVAALREMLGDQRRTWDSTSWVILSDDGEHTRETHRVTWYDSREKHPTRSEWRFYYTNAESGGTAVAPGDLLVVLRRNADELAFLAASPGSTWESQLQVIFGVPDGVGGAFVSSDLHSVDAAFVPVALELFDILGWNERTEDFACDIDPTVALEHFGGAFPSTADFSRYVRDRVPSEPGDPDDTLWRWWTCEDALFRQIERVMLKEQLDSGFEDVDSFLTYSLSVQNRRKARAGLAFENHLEALFTERGLSYSRGARSEGNRRPDFLFPGVQAYHDQAFPPERLTMLGAKTTCKERWRQVLTEAARIDQKHLVTLEPSVSPAQLTEMTEERLTLVAPKEILQTHTVPPGTGVLSLAEFIDLALSRERAQ